MKLLLAFLLLGTQAGADPRFWIKAKPTPIMKEDPEIVKERNRRFPPKPTVTPTQVPQ
jgi:hypothetical protein